MRGRLAREGEGLSPAREPPREVAEEDVNAEAKDPRLPPRQPHTRDLAVLQVLKRKKHESRRTIDDFYIRGAHPDEFEFCDSPPGTPPASPRAVKKTVRTTTHQESTLVVEDEYGYPEQPITGRVEPTTPADPAAEASPPQDVAAPPPSPPADPAAEAAPRAPSPTAPAAAQDPADHPINEEYEVITLDDSSSSGSSKSSKRKRDPGHETRRPTKRKKDDVVPTMEEFLSLKKQVEDLKAQLRAGREEQAEEEEPSRQPRIIIEFPDEAIEVKYNRIEQALPLSFDAEFIDIIRDTEGDECLDRIVEATVIEALENRSSKEKEKNEKKWMSKVLHKLFSNEYMSDYKVYDPRENYQQKAGTAMSKEVYEWTKKSVTTSATAYFEEGNEETFDWPTFLIKMRDVWRYTRCNLKRP